jgi:hypothetical protein
MYKHDLVIRYVAIPAIPQAQSVLSSHRCSLKVK